MQTQTIFQAGNSFVVAIPQHIARDMGLKVGQKVIVDRSVDGEKIEVKPTQKKVKNIKQSRASDAEFQAWLNMVLEEDKELLDELAHR